VRRRLFATAAAAVVLGTATVAVTAAGAAWGQQIPSTATVSHHDALVAYQRQHGYLPWPAHAGGTRVGAPAGTVAAAVGAPGRAPATGPSWVGITDTRNAPADPVNAIGPDSFIEMVNTTVAIYSRSGALLASGSTERLTGTGNPDDLSDPQVMWDPATNRFYYSVINEATERIELGFSKSARPTSIPGSFCNYHVNFGFGKALPDYQKLGSTAHDLLVGANVFPDDPNADIHADVAWMTKPVGTGTIATCPAQSSFRTGKQTNLLDHSVVGQGWTPVPAQQADPSTTGWVVGLPVLPDLESKGLIDLYKVSEKADGTPSIQKTATTVTVPVYTDPTAEPAHQKGTADTLDTLDGRFTHAVSAVDPNHGGATALWTAHTVVHGADPGGTTEVRWYEINVAAHKLFQSGTVSDPKRWVFNGAVSPDRTVTPAGAAHGGNMVLGFNTSSDSENVAVQMVSKVGAQPVSGFVKVFTSPGPDQGRDCDALGGACRWGDYAGAVPDPAASLSGSTGRVWLSAMTSTGGGPSRTRCEWSTFNWAATP
jgi:hypothetical protein